MFSRKPKKNVSYKDVELKYKGWFGLCPVYYDDPYKQMAPLVIERHAAYLPLMVLSEWIFGLLFFLVTAVYPLYEPVWPLKVTGRLRQPIKRRLTITED